MVAARSALLVASPGYYRPVISGGKAFPVARSNFLSIIRIYLRDYRPEGPPDSPDITEAEQTLQAPQ